MDTVNPKQALLEAGLFTIFYTSRSWLVICTHGSLVSSEKSRRLERIASIFKGRKTKSRWAKMVKDKAEVRSRVQAAQNACICHCSLVLSVSCLKVIKH